MSLNLFLPAIALAGAAPEKPATIDVAVPAVAIQGLASQVVATQVAPQTGTPEPVTIPPPTRPAETVTAPAPSTTTDLPAPSAAPVETAKSIGHAPGDPLEGFNRHMFAIHQKVDRAVFRPVALGYRHVVPKPVRSGFRNFFHNLGEPLVFLNDLLQFKPGRAARTLTRFLINSSIGIGGIMDVAKTRNVGLPHHPNGFGDTLGYYGVGPGPYIFLPLVGPSTLRDFVGGQSEGFVLPLAVGTPFDRWQFQMTRAVVNGLDTRAEADADFKALLDSAVDPYATLRSVYLQDRVAEIQGLHSGGGTTTTTGSPLDDPLSDPAGSSSSSPLNDPLTDPAAAPAAPADAGSSAPTQPQAATTAK